MSTYDNQTPYLTIMNLTNRIKQLEEQLAAKDLPHYYNGSIIDFLKEISTYDLFLVSLNINHGSSDLQIQVSMEINGQYTHGLIVIAAKELDDPRQVSCRYALRELLGKVKKVAKK